MQQYQFRRVPITLFPERADSRHQTAADGSGFILNTELWLFWIQGLLFGLGRSGSFISVFTVLGLLGTGSENCSGHSQHSSRSGAACCSLFVQEVG